MAGANIASDRREVEKVVNESAERLRGKVLNN